MRDNVFEPLGMKDTGFYVPAEKAARLAGVYVVESDDGNKLLRADAGTLPACRISPSRRRWNSGGGGSVSTVDDYALFCQMMLNKGELNGVRILKPETVALMEQNQLEDSVQTTSSAPGGRASAAARWASASTSRW